MITLFILPLQNISPGCTNTLIYIATMYGSLLLGVALELKHVVETNLKRLRKLSLYKLCIAFTNFKAVVHK